MKHNAGLAGSGMAVDQNDLDRDVQRWRNYVVFLARSQVAPHLRRKVDESDVVQQTLLEAHEARADFRGGTNAEYGAWLRQILARNLANLIRDYKRVKRDFRRERSLETQLTDFEKRADWLAAEHSSPSQRADRNLRLLQLADALASLSADQRTAIELRHLEGRTVIEIAESMKITTSAVGGLLYRGLQKLRDLLCHTTT